MGSFSSKMIVVVDRVAALSPTGNQVAFAKGLASIDALMARGQGTTLVHTVHSSIQHS